MVNANEIIDRVAGIYGISSDDMILKKRFRINADAKAVVCYVLCSLHFFTLCEVGRLLHLTHAAVIYHNRRAGDWMRRPKLNPKAVVAIREIEKEYNN